MAISAESENGTIFVFMLGLGKCFVPVIHTGSGYNRGMVKIKSAWAGFYKSKRCLYFTIGKISEWVMQAMVLMNHKNSGY